MALVKLGVITDVLVGTLATDEGIMREMDGQMAGKSYGIFHSPMR